MQNTDNTHTPKIAVSACLLGHPVRFNGGHKRDRFITDHLSQVLDFIPVCPEMEAGMGVPRPTIQLRRTETGVRLVQSDDGSVDYTDVMAEVAQRRAMSLRGRISGFIVQKKSPSCGMERVPVANADGKPADRTGVGMFVQHFINHCPLVPIEEEGRLNDPILRENFLERVYALDRWYRLDENDVAGFIEYHARHKLMLLARGNEAYSELGRIVAGVQKRNLTERRNAYIARFMQVMAQRVSRKRHYNVLQHMMGYLKKTLTSGDKQELLDLFQSYRLTQIPLATPMVLLKHHLRNHPVGYLKKQHYLKPYP
ncbi:MAG: DUF523 and DUF1722 domain-containing protein, partial [Gammaproteobacteria bacterium]|nr:DUF523 and DUF1722 domain-containing protein [Gammaproteobacteria bacterium]